MTSAVGTIILIALLLPAAVMLVLSIDRPRWRWAGWAVASAALVACALWVTNEEAQQAHRSREIWAFTAALDGALSEAALRDNRRDVVARDFRTLSSDGRPSRPCPFTPEALQAELKAKARHVESCAAVGADSIGARATLAGIRPSTVTVFISKSVWDDPATQAAILRALRSPAELCRLGRIYYERPYPGSPHDAAEQLGCEPSRTPPPHVTLVVRDRARPDCISRRNRFGGSNYVCGPEPRELARVRIS